MMRAAIHLSAGLAAALALGCNAERYLVAKIEPTQGNTARGEARFYEEPNGVRVVARLEGLTPGKHGFHLHAKGDCSAPDAMSAGGHYNPDSCAHAGPDMARAQRHRGDLGNLEAGADGRATYDRFDSVLTYSELEGLAVLVHAKEDDLASQPAGNAGPRVGCGVIHRKD